MNRINPKKLFRSKWTAVSPMKKEKHFMVTEVEFDEGEVVRSGDDETGRSDKLARPHR